MRILVIGSGGREHALAWKLAQSPKVTKVFVAPGNAGMAGVAESLPLAADKTVDLANFAVSSGIDLTVVGPEGPLVGGFVDYFRERKLPVFGPTKAAARLEGSKAFAKQVMEKAGVPTAGYRTFTDFEKAAEHLKQSPLPVVVKADGLAAGKGVTVARTREEALAAVSAALKERVFGDAGSQVVIEECLSGPEVSVLAVSDGARVALLESAQDHKRAYDNDEGPNTGGMGAYSPVPSVGPREMDQIRTRVFEPVIKQMAQMDAPFTGVLYAGLMLTAQGPKVLEFNVRFGDPETQAVLPRLKSDLVDLLLASVEGRIGEAAVEWDPRASACVVLASAGYPGKYDVGRAITGLNQVEGDPDVLVFHAGTKKEGGRLITAGGRILNVVGLGPSLQQAVRAAYGAVEKIQFEGKQYRRDIAAYALGGAGSDPAKQREEQTHGR